MLAVLIYTWWMAALIQHPSSTGRKRDKQDIGLEKKDIFFLAFLCQRGMACIL